jgi:hypothetical protein
VFIPETRLWLQRADGPATVRLASAAQREAERTMKAFVVERYGDADTVRAGDVPDPQ